MPRPTGILLVMLACAWLALAVTFRGAAWLLLWPALSFGAAGAGYLGLGATVFGKRDDGSVSVGRALVMAPYLLFGWIAWRAVGLGREPAFDQVTPWLYLGRRPAGHLPPDATAVIDLTAEFPVDRRLLGDRAYLCLPTLDGHVPDEQSLRRLVEQAHALGGVLYVHCAYGHGRSALVAGALLRLRGEVSSADEAIARMKAARPRVRLSTSQRAALARWDLPPSSS